MKNVFKVLLAMLLLGMVTPYQVRAEISKAAAENSSQQQKERLLRGLVTDKDGLPLPGVAVQVKGTTQGTTTNGDGEYYIMVKGVENPVLVFSFIGMETQEIPFEKGKHRINVVLEESQQVMEEVVVNGIFTRKAESFTGSAKTFKKDELKRMGNGNVFQSLKNLDASLKILDNAVMGSDPNSLPDMRLRGTSTFVEEGNTSLKGNYQSAANQPLFILDGFEASAEAIFDLDMNRIESITILKDAASKAIYGSKAAHGVIVVETVGLQGQGVRTTYNASLDIEMPDLTSYNLCNAVEKLEMEMLEGMIYDKSRPADMAKYNELRKKALEGYFQDWLSVPLRTGIGQKHNLTFEMGTKELNTQISVSYKNEEGVMKESFRRTLSGSAQVTYRVKNLMFRDIAQVTSNNAQNSPYGSFYEYAIMNPYTPIYDEYGKPTKQDAQNQYNYSPLYNYTTGSKSLTSYLNFTNNFYIEYKPIETATDILKLTARIGITSKRSDADEFYSHLHTKFDNIRNTEPDMLGSYTINNGKSTKVSADVYANYTKVANAHVLNANVGYSVSESNYLEYINTARGFRDLKMDEYLFAGAYDTGNPSGSALKSRDLGVVGVLAYSYDDRYLFDGTIRLNASSAFGTDKPWATFWSTGFGWNVHKEGFLKDSEWIKQLKLRGSIGYTGNQNFQSNKSASFYTYYNNDRYGASNIYWDGIYLTNMRNPGLEWELKKDINVGFDLNLKNILTMSAEWYRSDTENLVTQISLPGSTGFTSVSENLGLVRNEGIEVTMGLRVLNHKDYFLNLNAQIATNDNKLMKLSDAMRTFNERQKELAAGEKQTEPVTMYYEGMHMNTIWAVPSLGIDPSDGFEVYLDKNGKMTKKWSASDMVEAGINDTKYTGTFGLNGEYKGLGLSVTFRFMGGGQLYNTTLVDKVENVDIKNNVDRRVYSGRWKEAGQMTQFRRIFNDYNNYPLYFEALDEGSYTRATTRFVQDNNELNLSAISLYYDLPRKCLKPLGFERLRVQANMNDVYKWSTIEIERGTSYPFARTLSLSLSATF